MIKKLSCAVIGLLVVFMAGISCAATLTDETGRAIVLAGTPRRIVSLAPGITEILFALNLDDRIVGVTSFCDWPEKARQKAIIGGFTNQSLEKIVSLKPDLILATAEIGRASCRETV